MTKLSVNINKIATIRNARGGDVPNVVQFALDCEKYGAQGITVHPRPDERHIRYQDCRDLAPLVTTEFNIEGNPVSSFVDLVLETSPNQVTLVPDAEDVLTSNAGWDTVQYQSFLKDVITTCKEKGIRTSIFIDTDAKKIEAAASTGADRIELYTESYATAFAKGNYDYVNEFATAAEIAHQNGLGVNAGHDLSLDNIRHFKQNVPHLLEVSIGHSLISEALYLGISNTILGYLNRLES